AGDCSGPKTLYEGQAPAKSAGNTGLPTCGFSQTSLTGESCRFAGSPTRRFYAGPNFSTGASTNQCPPNSFKPGAVRLRHSIHALRFEMNFIDILLGLTELRLKGEDSYGAGFWSGLFGGFLPQPPSAEATKRLYFWAARP